MDGKIDNKQFGGISGTSTTDVLLEMVNKWYEATDNLDSYVRVVMLDFSKAFDLINHCLLIEKLQLYDLPEHVIRWVAAFLLGQKSKGKNWKALFTIWSPQWRSTTRNPIWSKMFLGLHKWFRNTCSFI